ncbi:MAG: hypothetical protein DMF40_06930 [Verrucomicrobia bacterium]|nr:MAG: hypothetical protein DME46_06100 [Verrucomicrobiota bacterium]PYL47835.1 MAG: hypothetical protein DMF40_06930 [Verrucomicrobiota bacterium]
MRTRLGVIVVGIVFVASGQQGFAQTCDTFCKPGNNVALSDEALRNLTTGQNNTALGAFTLFTTTTNSNNTATGYDALYFNAADNNTATGASALFGNRTGGNNTAMGANALLNDQSGSGNTAVGYNALSHYNDDSGTAVGFEALMNNSTGFGNTATGYQALSSNTSGDGNAGFGYFTLESNKTGSSNTAFGYGALTTNVSGSNNTAYGHFALINATGNSNVAVGSLAGNNLTSGSNNIDIGANVVGVAGEAKTIRIGTQGTQSSTFVAGISGVAVTGRQVVITSAGKLGVATSSARFKRAIRPMDKASEAILALNPVTFRYKKAIDPDSTPQFGLVAEEVEKIAPELVVYDENGEAFTVRYEAVNAMLLNEFLKEHRKATAEQCKVEAQARAIQELKGLVANQQKQIEKLTAGLQKVSDEVELAKPRAQVVAND